MKKIRILHWENDPHFASRVKSNLEEEDPECEALQRLAQGGDVSALAGILQRLRRALGKTQTFLSAEAVLRVGLPE